MGGILKEEEDDTVTLAWANVTGLTSKTMAIMQEAERGALRFTPMSLAPFRLASMRSTDTHPAYLA